MRLPSPTTEPAWVLRIDYALLALALILSFLVASFTASNGDLWLHLAVGKRISEGKFAFGVDPYSWATEATAEGPAVPWIHHSWLFSWLVYRVYESVLGGTGLVVIKAILFTLTMALLSRIGWHGPNRWFVLICLALAALAASGRLLLQPMVISLLFLAMTLFVLDRAGAFALPAISRSAALILGVVGFAAAVCALGESGRLVHSGADHGWDLLGRDGTGALVPEHEDAAGQDARVAVRRQRAGVSGESVSCARFSTAAGAGVSGFGGERPLHMPLPDALVAGGRGA